MTDREKLYELIDSVDIMNIPTENFRHSLADYLISNGVTVREKGEWITDGRRTECSQCHNKKSGGSQPEWYKFMEFCPDCGADMRGEQHGRNV